jgi:hypothetical protein
MKLLAVLSLLVAGIAAAADSAYQLDLGAVVQSGTLKVAPRVSGPAGKVLNYEMKVHREGAGKSSDSSQSGTLKLDQNGQARLASNSVNVSPGDRYEVAVRLLEAGRVVAQQSQRYP